MKFDWFCLLDKFGKRVFLKAIKFPLQPQGLNSHEEPRGQNVADGRNTMFFYTHGLFCTHDQVKCTVLPSAILL